jgi:hypothetical protein
LKTANPLLLFNPPENYSNSQARPNKRGIWPWTYFHDDTNNPSIATSEKEDRTWWNKLMSVKYLKAKLSLQVSINLIM